ncbi:MAG: MmgE/PrpD family protein [Deltaproteobacteria bacterium]|nr:MmgE/PrpD family protein [Deltaproteobacteria bacterium]
MNGATAQLADFVSTIQYETLPAEAIVTAKQAILDCLGCIVAGAAEPAVKITGDYARATNSSPEAGVLCQGFKTSAELAAWINGVASHCLDYDDVGIMAVHGNMHPSVSILPVVLALGEKNHSSGKEILTAFVAGIEAQLRLATVMGKQVSAAGWHPTPVLGVMGATAAACRLLSLNAEQTRCAFGIASSFAAGLQPNFGTMTKPLHAGNAARGGVVAGLLAARGFDANQKIFEEPLGFGNLFGGKGTAERMSQERSWNEKWQIVRGIAFKPYPSCRGTHPGIDAMLELRREFALRESDIASISCKVNPWDLELLRYHDPQNGLEAKFSLEYCLAVALLDGQVCLAHFADARVKDPKIKALIAKINCHSPADWADSPKLCQELTIKDHAGKEYTKKVLKPKGDPDNPLSDQELAVKFADCAATCFSKSERQEIIERIRSLETLSEIDKLMNLLMK